MEGLAHLCVVYVLWGSTYLAIRFAVREGSGFPPFWMAASRTLVAGSVLLRWACLAGDRGRVTRTELATLGAVGALMWLGGNGLLVWAEQWVDSGLAALIISTTPIWTAMLDAAVDRRPPSLLLLGSLVLGLAGVAALSGTILSGQRGGDLGSVLILLAASLTWAGGSFIQQRRPLAISPVASSGYQLFLGGLWLLAAGALMREPLPAPTVEASLAWVYLVLMGSVLGYTSFVRALRLLPASVAMTYAYVNPVIAVLLGALMLAEPITAFTLGGMALVLLAVAGVFRARQADEP